jgi:ubiquinone/menaquinone biosynthesis C-methylase UbiE
MNVMKTQWEELAGVDPLWAILSDSKKQYGKWNLDEFFSTGDHVIKNLMARCSSLGYPKHFQAALDFGCGVGRLTRALSKSFNECFGVDISQQMIDLANEYNNKYKNINFVVNPSRDLSIFPDHKFDLIYSYLVLQHIPKKSIIYSYIKEFIRTVRPGGLIAFQLPEWIHPLARLQPRRKIYTILNSVGFNGTFLYKKLGLNPIQMNFIPRNNVLSFIRQNNATILDIQDQKLATSTHKSCFYYITK